MSLTMPTNAAPAFSTSNIGQSPGSTAAGLSVLAMTALQAFGQNGAQMNTAGYISIAVAALAGFASMFGR